MYGSGQPKLEIISSVIGNRRQGLWCNLTTVTCSYQAPHQLELASNKQLRIGADTTALTLRLLYLHAKNSTANNTLPRATHLDVTIGEQVFHQRAVRAVHAWALVHWLGMSVSRWLGV